MTHSIRRSVGGLRLIVVTVIALSATIAQAQPAEIADPVAAFTAATQDYARMHRRLERIAGPITLNSSIDSINRSIGAFAASIRAERAGAEVGALFTPALARLLRARIGAALDAHGFTTADVLTEQAIESVDYANVHLRPNDTFPWRLAVTPFPCVIAALPELPSELQYRIVGEDLVLIDVHAGLVVDVLPAVLPDDTPR